MTGQSSSGSRLEAAVIPLAAILGAVILFGVFCAWVGASPAGVFASIYKAGFGSWYSWQNSLLRAAPLMLCGLATALPARAGVITVGNEGAFVVGGLAAAAAGLASAGGPAWLSLLFMAAAGGFAGGVWIALAAGFQHYRGVNAVISSLLLNYIGIALLLQLVEGPMHDPGSLNFPATYPIPETHQLGHLPHTRVHYGLVFGVVACLVAWFLLERTVWGMEVKTVGGNTRTAKLVGLPLGRIILTASFLGGACAGVAGMVEVAAIHGRASQAISAGYGYVGILVAFLARQSPLRILFVSLVLGAVLASGGILQRDHELPDATIAVFEGIAFLTVLASEALSGRFAFLGTRPRAAVREMADVKS
jgi:general nucleoside transport system permease protein